MKIEFHPRHFWLNALIIMGVAACGGSGSDGASGSMASVSSVGISGQPQQSITETAAQSSAESATVSWSAPVDNTDGSDFIPTGFMIYFGTRRDALDQSVAVNSPHATSYTLTNLTKGQTYYFAVAAINSSNTEGHLSSITSLSL